MAIASDTRGGLTMAVKVVHVSDVSDKEGSQEELGTLEVLEHPEIGEPARLEIFPDEFEQLQSADRIVRLRWTAPDGLEIHGWLVRPKGKAPHPLIVDINPRLTTSYLGYRALATSNLAARIVHLDADHVPLNWSAAAVEFRADGQGGRSSASRG